MMYLIVGRTGSGKDYLAERLSDAGLRVVKSYTTRPKRTDNEDSHIFISPEEVATYTDKVSTTTINGYEYFATKSQIDNSDVFIVDPIGVEELTRNMPDTTFHIIYVKANDMDRRIHAVKRATDKIKEELIFDKRDESENDEFTEFEEKLKSIGSNNVFAENVTTIHLYNNDYNEPTANEYLSYYLYTKELHDRMTGIVDECTSLDLLASTDENKLSINKTDGSVKLVTKEHFADVLLSNNDKFAELMKGYIALSNQFSKGSGVKD